MRAMPGTQAAWKYANKLDLIILMWDTYINANTNPHTKKGSRSHHITDIFPLYISEKIMKTIVISTGIIKSFRKERSILLWVKRKPMETEKEDLNSIPQRKKNFCRTKANIRCWKWIEKNRAMSNNWLGKKVSNLCKVIIEKKNMTEPTRFICLTRIS